jgi:hypothetical protein
VRQIRWIGAAAMAAALLMWTAAPASAEPHMLSKQYTRCTSCHLSPTGGGLLSSYGRSLSATELSTMRTPVPADENAPPGEEGFLFGLLGERLEPVHLGASLRPSRLHYTFPGGSTDRNLLMNADITAAVAAENGWTVLGTIARKPSPDGSMEATEYWLGKVPKDDGIGFRAGRFRPAYGVHFADHTAFNRAVLELTQYDQVLGAEVSHARGATLTQISLSAGRAESLIDDDGRAGVTATGRVQRDLGARMAVVGSALYRAKGDIVPRRGAVGAAFGFAPASAVSVWTQFDRVMVDGAGGAAHVLVNESAFEVHRGVWIKISPQWYFGAGTSLADRFRFQIGAVLLPRTHFNVNVSYYRDSTKATSVKTHIFLSQLHLYL